VISAVSFTSSSIQAHAGSRRGASGLASGQTPSLAWPWGDVLELRRTIHELVGTRALVARAHSLTEITSEIASGSPLASSLAMASRLSRLGQSHVSGRGGGGAVGGGAEGGGGSGQSSSTALGRLPGCWASSSRPEKSANSPSRASIVPTVVLEAQLEVHQPLTQQL